VKAGICRVYAHAHQGSQFRQPVGVFSDNAGATNTIELHNVSFDIVTTNGTAVAIRNKGNSGGIYVYGSAIPANLIDGAVTYVGTFPAPNVSGSARLVQQRLDGRLRPGIGQRILSATVPPADRRSATRAEGSPIVETDHS